jgi:hypothetical protein
MANAFFSHSLILLFLDSPAEFCLLNSLKVLLSTKLFRLWNIYTPTGT